MPQCRLFTHNETFFAGSARHPETIKRNVPGQFLPMGLGKVVAHFARNPGAPEHRGDIMSPRFRPAAKFPDHDRPMINVINNAELNAVQTDKTETAQDLVRW